MTNNFCYLFFNINFGLQAVLICCGLLLLCNSRMGIMDPSAAVSIKINCPVPSTGNWSWTSRCGGLSQRLRRQGHRQIPLPTVTVTNVWLLHNKVDELQGNVMFLSTERTVSWPSRRCGWEQDSRSDADINGFGVPFCQDSNPTCDHHVSVSMENCVIRWLLGRNCAPKTSNCMPCDSNSKLWAILKSNMHYINISVSKNLYSDATTPSRNILYMLDVM